MRFLLHYFRNATDNLRKKAAISLAIIFALYLATFLPAENIKNLYQKQQSVVIRDRHGEIIRILPNGRGYYARKTETVPENFLKLLLKKEDRFFFLHPGFNPLSIVRDLAGWPFRRKLTGSSAITQQLVKVLLGHEGQRTIGNKFIELAYAVSLELHTKKSEILAMYLDSVYFGNQAQGLEEASRFYFGVPPQFLNERQTLELLAAINNPSGREPDSFANRKFLPTLAAAIGATLGKEEEPAPPKTAKTDPNLARTTPTAFELANLDANCRDDCRLTIDRNIAEELRNVLARNLASSALAGVDNGAIVAIKLPENEVLAMIGSPNPTRQDRGYQINMAVSPRPIGSTAKPFIYLKAFEKGLRPYSLVEDREYKYIIATGFPIYPKNYDGQYRGIVTLHQALSNSLNVPSVKVLEYAGLDPVYDLLRNRLGFKPVQPLENYQLGIALGAMEMDLMTLAHFFTIFPNEGILKPLKMLADRAGDEAYIASPMAEKITAPKRAADRQFIQLVNKILSDRETAVEQFGLKSSLNLAASNYALKTGTSRDFHDSWTIGYTPDFLIGVWLGNSSNRPMPQISGQSGAGKIWHEAMELLLNSEYNKKTPLAFDAIKEFVASGSVEYGLAGDDYEKTRRVLMLEDQALITYPHNADTFLYEANTKIPLRAKRQVEWLVNGESLGRASELVWHPPRAGRYLITAETEGQKETISIVITAEE